MADGEIEGVHVTAPRIYIDSSIAFQGFTYEWKYALSGGGGLSGAYVSVNNGVVGDTIYKVDGCEIKIMDEEEDLSPEQLGIIRQFINNASGEDNLARALKDCADNNNRVELHFDEFVHFPNGTKQTWEEHDAAQNIMPGKATYGRMVPSGPQDGVIKISLNPKYLDNNIVKFQEILVHEFLHILWPGDIGHARINPLVPRVVEAVFKKDNSDDYYNAGKTIGTEGDDVLTGGDGFNDIAGLGGDDTIIGGPTDDYVDGGAGDDYISTGAGNDYIIPGPAGSDAGDVLKGGYGDDTYVMMTAANVRTIDDVGGSADGLYIDTDSTAHVFHNPANDNIVITGLQTYSTITIINGDAGGKIEWVEMNNHTQLNTDPVGGFYSMSFAGVSDSPTLLSVISGLPDDPKLIAALARAGAFDGLFEVDYSEIIIAGSPPSLPDFI